jgi:hemolysin activation/secretion protein
VAIAAGISDLYRAAGFHLSRAIVPPQDIRDGQVRLEVIEGSITEVALKGEGAERFGVRTLLDPVLAEQPARLPLERQLLLINGRPGVSIADTALEETPKRSLSLHPGRRALQPEVQAEVERRIAAPAGSSATERLDRSPMPNARGDS